MTTLVKADPCPNLITRIAISSTTQIASPDWHSGLNANEILTILWLMRRGRSRFVEASRYIETLAHKGIVHHSGRWDNTIVWAIDERVWSTRVQFQAARHLLSTPNHFPPDGVFMSSDTQRSPQSLTTVSG